MTEKLLTGMLSIKQNKTKFIEKTVFPDLRSKILLIGTYVYEASLDIILCREQIKKVTDQTVHVRLACEAETN